MSRRQSTKSTKSSSSSGVAFDVCGVSASSTPAKTSSAPGPAGRSTDPNLSVTLNDDQKAASTPSRSAQFPAFDSQRSSRSRSSRLSGIEPSRLFDSIFNETDPGVLGDSLTVDSLTRLLAEEAEDVRLASLLSTSGAFGASAGLGPPPTRFPLNESLQHAQKDLRALPVGDSVLFLGEGEEPGNLCPGEVAAMMHRLEHGVCATAPPGQLFKFLFPKASRTSSRTAVAPGQVKSSGEANGSSRGAPERPQTAEAEAAAEGKTSGKESAPNENTLHKNESCPVVCFGGPTSPHTMLQMRGYAPPAWFPGYFVALPQTGGVLQVKQSPTEVMQAAYMAARPRNIPPECRFEY